MRTGESLMKQSGKHIAKHLLLPAGAMCSPVYGFEDSPFSVYRTCSTSFSNTMHSIDPRTTIDFCSKTTSLDGGSYKGQQHFLSYLILRPNAVHSVFLLLVFFLSSFSTIFLPHANAYERQTMDLAIEVPSVSRVIVVAKEGGEYTTIQSALDAIPATNSQYVLIYVKKGVYNEHVSITKNFIAIVGEDRDSVRIEYSLPRKEWYTAHGTNTGCGVVNIAANDSCIVIGNMTIINTYDGSEDYTEVIRSETGSTKIWVINCTVWCKYKDTFALWGKANGRYYASDCSFKGSIDAVCPRGWCYILHSEFIETRYSSPIWHEGVSGLNQKFVIRYGWVRSELSKYIKLQNAQNYAQFYYLDCAFSDSIETQGNGSPTYYWNCHRRGSLGDASWFATNLSSAPSSPKHTDITPAWIFDGVWDPENEMPPVLPFASLPQPFHRAYDVPSTLRQLKWTGRWNALSYNVYLGTSAEPQFVGTVSSTTYSLPMLQPSQRYYWRVDVVTSEGIVRGSTWEFTTATTTSVEAEQNLPPTGAVVTNYPNPFNPATEIQFTVPTRCKVTVKVFDVLGNEVAQLFEGMAESGVLYRRTFEANNLASGIYYAVIEGPQVFAVRKMIVLR